MSRAPKIRGEIDLRTRYPYSVIWKLFAETGNRPLTLGELAYVLLKDHEYPHFVTEDKKKRYERKNEIETLKQKWIKQMRDDISNPWWREMFPKMQEPILYNRNNQPMKYTQLSNNIATLKKWDVIEKEGRKYKLNENLLLKYEIESNILKRLTTIRSADIWAEKSKGTVMRDIFWGNGQRRWVTLPNRGIKYFWFNPEKFRGKIENENDAFLRLNSKLEECNEELERLWKKIKLREIGDKINKALTNQIKYIESKCIFLEAVKYKVAKMLSEDGKEKYQKYLNRIYHPNVKDYDEIDSINIKHADIYTTEKSKNKEEIIKNFVNVVTKELGHIKDRKKIIKEAEKWVQKVFEGNDFAIHNRPMVILH
jgi:hypothetical protein